MATLAIAYAVIWVGITLYVLRLGLQQRRLSKRLETLQSHITQAKHGEDSSSIAA